MTNNKEFKIIGITDITIRNILQNAGADALALYVTYAEIEQWQQTYKVKAVTGFMAKRMKWGKDKVIKNKKLLIDLGLVFDVQDRGEDGKIKGWYIKIRHTVSDTSEIQPPSDITESGKTQGVIKSDTSATNNNISATNNSLSTLEKVKKTPQKAVARGEIFSSLPDTLPSTLSETLSETLSSTKIEEVFNLNNEADKMMRLPSSGVRSNQLKLLKYIGWMIKKKMSEQGVEYKDKITNKKQLSGIISRHIKAAQVLSDSGVTTKQLEYALKKIHTEWIAVSKSWTLETINKALTS